MSRSKRAELDVRRPPLGVLDLGVEADQQRRRPRPAELGQEGIWSRSSAASRAAWPASTRAFQCRASSGGRSGVAAVAAQLGDHRPLLLQPRDLRRQLRVELLEQRVVTLAGVRQHVRDRLEGESQPGEPLDAEHPDEVVDVVPR